MMATLTTTAVGVPLYNAGLLLPGPDILPVKSLGTDGIN